MIPDVNPGLKRYILMRIFLPTFEAKEDLEEHLDWYLEHHVEIDNDAYECREMAKKFTFERVVDKIESVIRKGA